MASIRESDCYHKAVLLIHMPMTALKANIEKIVGLSALSYSESVYPLPHIIVDKTSPPISASWPSLRINREHSFFNTALVNAPILFQTETT